MKPTLFDKNKKLDGIVKEAYNSGNLLSIVVSAEETRGESSGQKYRKVDYLVCPDEKVGGVNPSPYKENIQLDGNDHPETIDETAKRKSEDLVNSLKKFLGEKAEISVSEDNIIKIKNPKGALNTEDNSYDTDILPTKDNSYDKINTLATKNLSYNEDISNSIMGLYIRSKKDIIIKVKAEPEKDRYHITANVYEADKKIVSCEWSVKNDVELNTALETEKERFFEFVKGDINNYFNTFPESHRKITTGKLEDKTDETFEGFTYKDEGIKDNTASIIIKPILELVRAANSKDSE